ncbi:hypothetical protein [Sphingobacterium kyonggiense]
MKIKEDGSFRTLNYIIAENLVQIVDKIGIQESLELPNFNAFALKDETFEKPLITIELTGEVYTLDDSNLKLLSDVSIIWKERFRFEEGSDHYITSILGSDGNAGWKMKSSKDFLNSTIYFHRDELYSSSKLSWLILVAFGQACLSANTIMIHSSVVEFEGRGYAFLGNSGTGKSTHSRLWIDHIVGSKLLNDDNPAIRIKDEGDVYIYGTPWSGKTPCYINKGVPLCAISRLSQAPFNRYTPMEGYRALIALLPSGTAIRWNSLIYNKMLTMLELLIKKVPIGYLECLPNQQAALIHQDSLENDKS